MSRRRYISTDISFDALVNRLAVTAGDFAVLIYTWMIPHASDQGIIRATPEELLFLVIPGRRDKQESDITQALTAMSDLGLIEWRRESNEILFPVGPFYKYQTYIQNKNRRGFAEIGDASEHQRKTPQNAANQQSSLKSAENTASPSPSPSPSLSGELPPNNARTREDREHPVTGPTNAYHREPPTLVRPKGSRDAVKVVDFYRPAPENEHDPSEGGPIWREMREELLARLERGDIGRAGEYPESEKLVFVSEHDGVLTVRHPRPLTNRLRTEVEALVRQCALGETIVVEWPAEAAAS